MTNHQRLGVIAGRAHRLRIVLDPQNATPTSDWMNSSASKATAARCSSASATSSKSIPRQDGRGVVLLRGTQHSTGTLPFMIEIKTLG